MKFSTREDTDLSADELFAAISDFPKLERFLQRRGAMVRRVDGKSDAWQIGFDWRAKPRNIDLAVVSVVQPERVELAGHSEMFELGIRMTVVPLTRHKSRLVFDTEVRPRGMRARLLLQTAKLTRSQIDRKFARGIGDFVNRIAAGQG